MEILTIKTFEDDQNYKRGKKKLFIFTIFKVSHSIFSFALYQMIAVKKNYTTACATQSLKQICNKHHTNFY